MERRDVTKRTRHSGRKLFRTGHQLRRGLATMLLSEVRFSRRHRFARELSGSQLKRRSHGGQGWQEGQGKEQATASEETQTRGTKEAGQGPATDSVARPPSGLPVLPSGPPGD